MTNKQKTNHSPHYMNTAEAAEFLRLSPRTLGNMRVSGDGPPYRKHGRLVVYLKAELAEWSESRRQESTSDVR